MLDTIIFILTVLINVYNLIKISNKCNNKNINIELHKKLVLFFTFCFHKPSLDKYLT